MKRYSLLSLIISICCHTAIAGAQTIIHPSDIVKKPINNKDVSLEAGFNKNSSPASNQPYYQDTFSENIIMVTSSDDLGSKGSLRQAIIMANTMQNVSPFKMFSIKFGSNVDQIVLKSPLPELKASLVSINCNAGNRHVIIDGAGNPGLVISGNRNLIVACNLTHFERAALIISGNRNSIKNNMIYANAGSALIIENGASNNEISDNMFNQNQKDVIKVLNSSGSENFIAGNKFNENLGSNITNLSKLKQIIQTDEVAKTQSSETSPYSTDETKINEAHSLAPDPQKLIKLEKEANFDIQGQGTPSHEPVSVDSEINPPEFGY